MGIIIILSTEASNVQPNQSNAEACEAHTKQQMVRSAPRIMSKEKARSAEPGIDQSSLPGGDKL